MSRETLLGTCRDRWGACDPDARLRLYVGGNTISIGYRDLEERCAGTLAQLERGNRRESVALLLPHSVELFLLHVGLVLEGRCPAILPWPTRRIDPRKYVRNLAHQLRQLAIDRLITVPEVAGVLRGALPFPVEGCSLPPGTYTTGIFTSLVEPLERASSPAPQQSLGSFADDPLFLQFSGGTTGHQKCVPVTASMLESQLERLAQALALDRRDGVVSWLPLYHDMGLIACLWFPLWCGVASLHMAPGDWILQPELLFRFLEEYHGTYCWLPNFAFSYLARRRQALDRSYSLGHVRGWVSCSEPIRQASLEEFVAAYEDWGVTRRSLQTSYAMAENVFAVSHSAIGEEPRTVARSAIGQGAAASPMFDLVDEVYVSSGRLLADMRVRIVGPDGTVCGEKEAGELHLQTPCLFDGYASSAGISKEALTSDGWYATGDHGFFDAGELFVTGRVKDIIIVGGQNIFPDDIEAGVNGVAGVYPGRAVAFGVDDRALGTEAIGVVAEMTGDFDEARAAALEMEIRQAVMACVAVAPRFVAVVPRRWIVKSTAGKISRKETREKFVRERLHESVLGG